MKRSDAVRRMNELAQEMASLAREVWDPEEEPMAGRLGVLGGVLGAATANGKWLREATEAEKCVAADLYNRRGLIASVIGELRAWHAASQAGRTHTWPGPGRLADRLEGKE